MSTQTPIKILDITRLFDAPLDLVYRAWTEPELISKWWGPHGFTTPVKDWDAKVGGAIDLSMIGFGMDHPMVGDFLEVDPPNRLVFTAKAFLDGAGSNGLEVLNTVTFKAVGERTEVALHAKVVKATEEVAMALAGMEQGWSESLDKFGSLVSRIHFHEADYEMVAVRTYVAPRELVWKVWTEQEHTIKWWGTNGFTTTTNSMDLRPGVTWSHVMHGPDGRDYHNRVRYLEVAAPHRLVYENATEDEPDNVLHRSVVTFTEEDGRTTVVMRMRFSSQEEKEMLIEKYGVLQGGIQHMANLDAYLNKVK